jgi:hypothetical protein
MTSCLIQYIAKTHVGQGAKNYKSSKEKEEKEKFLLIKRRKEMQGAFPNPKLLASHTITRPQQP